MVSPLPKFAEARTGRLRVRRGWFGRKVVQVEIKRERLTDWPPFETVGQPPDFYWRDAKWSDFELSLSDRGSISMGGFDAA